MSPDRQQDLKEAAEDVRGLLCYIAGIPRHPLIREALKGSALQSFDLKVNTLLVPETSLYNRKCTRTEAEMSNSAQPLVLIAAVTSWLLKRQTNAGQGQKLLPPFPYGIFGLGCFPL